MCVLFGGLERGREKVYMQTRRFSAPKIREVVTRDDSEAQLAFPYYRDVSVCWEPNDSVHRGKLFLQEAIGGQPSYVECCPPDKAPHEWIAKLQSVRHDLQQAYRSSNVFDGERIREWEAFMDSMPWEGNCTIDPQLLPDFTIPDAPPETPGAEEGHHHSQAMAVLMNAGLDSSGNLRAYFKEGVDLLKYPRAESVVTYGNRCLNGVRYDPATMGKRKRTGKT